MWFKKKSSKANEMGFLDHLEELRWRIVKSRTWNSRWWNSLLDLY